MTTGTATKVVVGFALGGTALALWFGKDGADRYRKVWGITILSAAGAALSEFAPSLVGWFFALVIFAYAVGHQSTITSAVGGIKSQAGVSNTNTNQKGKTK